MTKSILIGFHDPRQVHMFERISHHKGYAVESVTNKKDMIDRISSKEYTCYLMDINLDHPNSSHITSALHAYELVQPRVESGLAKFMALSGNDHAVQLARAAGIPAEEKTAFSLLKFLSN